MTLGRGYLMGRTPAILPGVYELLPGRIERAGTYIHDAGRCSSRGNWRLLLRLAQRRREAFEAVAGVRFARGRSIWRHELRPTAKHVRPIFSPWAPRLHKGELPKWPERRSHREICGVRLRPISLHIWCSRTSSRSCVPRGPHRNCLCSSATPVQLLDLVKLERSGRLRKEH